MLAAQRDELAQQSALELLAVANRRLAARAARDEQRASAEAARLDRERAVVRAEVGGTVASEGRASVRDSVDAGAAVMTLTPAGPLRVDAAIPAADVTAVSMGAPARVILEGHEVDGRTVVHGRVRYIAADSERVAALGGHVFVVSIALEDGAALRAGMTGRAEIEVARRSLLRLLLEHLSHRLALG